MFALSVFVSSPRLVSRYRCRTHSRASCGSTYPLSIFPLNTNPHPVVARRRHNTVQSSTDMARPPMSTNRRRTKVYPTLCHCVQSISLFLTLSKSTTLPTEVVSPSSASAALSSPVHIPTLFPSPSLHQNVLSPPYRPLLSVLDEPQSRSAGLFSALWAKKARLSAYLFSQQHPRDRKSVV